MKIFNSIQATIMQPMQIKIVSIVLCSPLNVSFQYFVRILSDDAIRIRDRFGDDGSGSHDTSWCDGNPFQYGYLAADPDMIVDLHGEGRIDDILILIQNRMPVRIHYQNIPG